MQISIRNSITFTASLCLIFQLLTTGVSEAENKWTIEAFLGTVHNFSTTLDLERPEGTQEIDADYETNPFDDPFYYALRAGKSGWEVEFIHHKIRLTNAPLNVQRFEVSHGYNLLFVNRAWDISGFILRAGGGVVIPHVEATLSGSLQPSEYSLTGPAGQVSIGTRLHFNRTIFAAFEVKFTAARAVVSLQDADVRVPNVALHGLFGLGFAL